MFQPFNRERKHDGETAGYVPDAVTLRKWSTMDTALILYAIYAICVSAVLIFSTLPQERPVPRSGPQAPNGRIKYVVIPSSSFHEWAHCNPNLVTLTCRPIVKETHGTRAFPSRSRSLLVTYLACSSGFRPRVLWSFLVVTPWNASMRRVKAHSFGSASMSFSFWTEALRSANCSLASGRNAEVLVRGSHRQEETRANKGVR